MSALSELLLDDREEEQGAACDLSASADTQEAEQAAKGASPSPQVSKEEQEKQRRAEHEAKEAARKAEFEEKAAAQKREKRTSAASGSCYVRCRCDGGRYKNDRGAGERNPEGIQ